MYKSRKGTLLLLILRKAPFLSSKLQNLDNKDKSEILLFHDSISCFRMIWHILLCSLVGTAYHKGMVDRIDVRSPLLSSAAPWVGESTHQSWE